MIDSIDHSRPMQRHIGEACLALALLVPRVAANHEHHATAPHELAVFTDAFDAGADFHWPALLHLTVAHFDLAHRQLAPCDQMSVIPGTSPKATEYKGMGAFRSRPLGRKIEILVACLSP
jgi:hypothetical protein